MKTLNIKQTLAAIAAIVGLSVGSSALAQNTAANTAIDNTAILSFTVAGVTGTTTLESSETGNSDPAVTGNPTSFVVDRVIDFTLAEVGSAFNSDDTLTASSGQDNVVLEYVLTNDSNAPLGFEFHAEANSAEEATLLGSIAGFTFTPDVGQPPLTEFPTAPTVSVFVDGNDNDTFDDGTDSNTSVETLAPGANVNIFVVIDLPGTQVQNNYSAVTLVAQAAEIGAVASGSAGARITNDSNGNISPGGSSTTAADDSAVVDDVFADDAGDTSYNFGAGSGFAIDGDIARDGQHSDTDILLVNGARLSVQKEVETIWDPVNANTSPKAIPGSYVRYTITIENIGGATANLTTIADTIDADLAFDTTLLLGTDCTDTGTPGAGCTAGDGSTFGVSADGASVAFTNTGTGADFVTYLASGVPVFSGSVFSVDLSSVLITGVSNTGNTNAGDLDAGEMLVITFNAIIQ